MSTGVKVHDSCLEAYQDLKLGKKLKYIIFRISDDSTEVIVDQKAKEAKYDEFVKTLPKKECRYCVYDFEYEHEEGGTRNKICFVFWGPDDAPVRNKMVYAGTKEALRRKLDGIATEIQATDSSEISYDTVLDKVKRG